MRQARQRFITCWRDRPVLSEEGCGEVGGMLADSRGSLRGVPGTPPGGVVSELARSGRKRICGHKTGAASSGGSAQTESEWQSILCVQGIRLGWLIQMR